MNNRRKFTHKDIPDIILNVLMILGFASLLHGFGVAVVDVPQLRDYRFKNESHIETVASAFRFELAPGETLYVKHFFPGFLQGTKFLYVAVDNVESVESFLSRFQLDIKEASRHRSMPVAIETYSVDIDNYAANRSMEFSSFLTFFDDEGQINAEIFITHRGSISELNEMYSLLYELLRPWWAHPFFLGTLAIQAILVAIAIFRYKKHRNAEKIGGN